MVKSAYGIKRQERLAAYVLLAPAVILFVVIGLGSVLFSLIISFYRLGEGSLIQYAVFVGFRNFSDFLFGVNTLDTQQFWGAITNNIWIAASALVFVIPISLFLASMLQKITRGTQILRTIFLIPMAAASVAIYYAWSGIYNPNGVINQLLTHLGLQQFAAVNGWLGQLNTALPAIIVAFVWMSVPVSMVLYFAGLQTINENLYEAANIDGANAWNKLIHITWPTLRPITVIVAILNLNAAFQIFDPIWVMTGGGPADATNVVNVLVYGLAFGGAGGDMGLANAMAWVVGIFTFLLALLSIKLFGENQG